MRAQRPVLGRHPVWAGVAGALPFFADRSFDAAMAVSTDQHWPDVIAGYRELRVSPAKSTPSFDISRLDATSGERELDTGGGLRAIQP